MIIFVLEMCCFMAIWKTVWNSTIFKDGIRHADDSVVCRHGKETAKAHTAWCKRKLKEKYNLKKRQYPSTFDMSHGHHQLWKLFSFFVKFK